VSLGRFGACALYSGQPGTSGLRFWEEALIPVRLTCRLEHQDGTAG
jgi:hypothetical protein